MDLVLGMSMAPSTVRMVLVEGKMLTAPPSTRMVSRLPPQRIPVTQQP